MDFILIAKKMLLKLKNYYTYFRSFEFQLTLDHITILAMTINILSLNILRKCVKYFGKFVFLTFKQQKRVVTRELFIDFKKGFPFQLGI